MLITILLTANGALGGLLIGILGVTVLLTSIYLIFRHTLRKHPIKPIYLIFSFLLMSLVFRNGLESLLEVITRIFTETADVFRGTALIPSGNEADGSTVTSDSYQLVSSVFKGKLWYNAILFFTGFLFIAFVSEKLIEYIYRSGLDAEKQPDGKKDNARILIKNGVITVILISAIYFTISAIIAVPIMSDQANNSLKLSEVLSEEINAFSRNDQALKQEYKNNLVREWKLIDKIARDSVQNEKMEVVNFHRYIDTFSVFKAEIDAIFGKLEHIGNLAVKRMEMTDNAQINPRLQIQDKAELSNWYLENRYALFSYLDEHKHQINAAINEMVYLLDFEDYDTYEIFDYDLQKVVPAHTEIPPRPVLGSDLGVFTFFTGWLLSVESYPLVIIIGLIGFGLLGAGGATFIREQDRDNKQVLIDDIGGVLVKGFTAAIVVFLGVQGSLAVLTTDGGSLNAYALFFVCFVAAVFSDDAWNWARKRFGEGFSAEEQPTPEEEVPDVVVPAEEEAAIPVDATAAETATVVMKEDPTAESMLEDEVDQERKSRPEDPAKTNE